LLWKNINYYILTSFWWMMPLITIIIEKLKHPQYFYTCVKMQFYNTLHSSKPKHLLFKIFIYIIFTTRSYVINPHGYVHCIIYLWFTKSWIYGCGIEFSNTISNVHSRANDIAQINKLEVNLNYSMWAH
jgi:hypothetical protein